MLPTVSRANRFPTLSLRFFIAPLKFRVVGQLAERYAGILR
jgi:hypothetical protein